MLMSFQRIPPTVRWAVLFAFVIVAVLFFLQIPKTGTVTKIVKHPNSNGDGYYSITVRDSTGQEYVIDITGHMNLPKRETMQPCVKVPDVRVGDSLSFYLPKADSKNEYTICPDQNILSPYYIKLNNSVNL